MKYRFTTVSFKKQYLINKDRDFAIFISKATCLIFFAAVGDYYF